MTEPESVAKQPADTDQHVMRKTTASGSPSWRHRHYAKNTLRVVVALFAFIVLFYWIGGVGELSIHRPFEYSGDALEVLSLQAHDYIANDYATRMRAPFELAKPEGGHYLYNALFRSNSNLLWIAKLLGEGGAAKTLNLAYLFSFLLVFLSGYWVCGRLGLRDPFRFCAASLFALMPYHFQRAENHFLESCYYFVPLLALVILELWSARPLACNWICNRWQLTWRDRRIWLALILLTFLTPCNPYHQFFFACLVAAVAPFAAAYRRNWRPLLVGWGLAVFACAVLVLEHMLAHHLSSPELALGVNNQPISNYGGAEVYPLKLTQLLLPVQGHRWSVLASLRHMYDVANPMNNENSTTTLGLVGSLGVLSCMALALAPAAKLRMSRAGKMGLITLMAVLFGSMGGFSSLISTIGMELLGPRSQLVQARGWDRIVLFVGFFAYFTAFWLLQRWGKSIASRLFQGWKQTTLIWMIGIAVFAFALWDQVPYKVSQQRDGHYRSDLQFFGALQKQLPPNSRVFQLPFVVHHYSGFVLPGVYYTQMLRPYIASHDLRFTYGGDRLSVQSQWLRAASALPAAQAARYLCRYGFAGVLVQRNMLKKPAVLEDQWQAVLGKGPRVSEDGDYAFFDLEPYCRSQEVRPLDLGVRTAQLLKQLREGRQLLPGGAFAHHTGQVILKADGSIVIRANTGETGYVAYGPYATLAPGRYRALFRFSSVTNNGGQGALTVDVAARKFKKSLVLAHSNFRPLSGSGVTEKSLVFVVGRYDGSLQYRVTKTLGIGVDFLGVEIERLPD